MKQEKKAMKYILAAMLASAWLGGHWLAAQETTEVAVVSAGGVYKLQVEGEDYQIKGVVWDYSPIGENYNYSLWNEPENFIRRVLDRDGQLMSAMGVNTIRSFSGIPPKWVSYLYVRWGIRSIINPLFGRYGVSARGKWNYPTDYSDYYQREAILNEALQAVETYKDTPGVLLFLFGNENNYGLEWTSTEIENLPVGERNTSKAAYLYTLFEEAIGRAKQIDSQHPIGFINGDVQYASLFADIVQSADLIGLNSYRGASFGDLFAKMQQTGKPFVFTEFGADAYNVLSQQEDQVSQQYYIVNQWRELYHHAGGNKDSGTGNVLGGFVFGWTDGWWKHDQGDYEKSEIHDTAGTWSNGAYIFDFDGKKNNMNEEWFGLAGLQPSSLLKGDFLNRIEQLELRSAYYSLQKLWVLDLYNATPEEVDAVADALLPTEAMEVLHKGQTNQQKALDWARRAVSVDSLSASMVASNATKVVNSKNVAENLDNSTFAHSQALRATIASRPFENAYAAATVKLVGNYFEPYFINAAAENYGSKHFQVYSAEVMYDGRYFDANGYYRNGHSDWATEGDYFFMLSESYDLHALDTEDSQAPFGAELIGNRFLKGLTIYGGPEIYKGAKPQVAFKYNRDFGFGSWGMGFAGIYIEELDYARGAAHNLSSQPTRKASLYNYWDFAPFLRLDYGLYFSGMNKIGEEFLYSQAADSGRGLGGTNTKVKAGKIGILDTLALKFRLTTEIFRYTKIYGQGILAGAVADSNGAISRDGFIRADSGKGNRIEFELGGLFVYGNFGAGLKARYRRNIFQPLPVGYFLTRSQTQSPFVVTAGNRETLEAEALVSFDPTGATYLHNFDMADRENAPIAGSLGLLWSFYNGATDPANYITASSSSATFPKGLGVQHNIWAAQLKVVANPGGLGLHLVASAILGREGSSKGDNTQLKPYWGLGLDGWWGPVILRSFLKYNYWGPEGYYREFNKTFPWQWGIDIALALEGKPSLLKDISKIGFKVESRHYGKNKTTLEPDALLEFQAYITLVLAKSHQPKLASR